jgi:transcriptional regulator with XRE-family HTH domain
MRKSSYPTSNYRSGFSRGPVVLATFRDQMADYARAEQLRELRAEAHLSQEAVAHEIGVSVKSVRTWEAGGKIRWPNAQKLGALYGVDPKTLVSRSKEPGTPDLMESLNGSGPLDQINAKLDAIIAHFEIDIPAETVTRLSKAAQTDLRPDAGPQAPPRTGKPSDAKRGSQRPRARGKRTA